MEMSRREAVKLLGACVASGSLDIYALAQVKMNPVRIPLDDFVQNATFLKALRRGVRAMKKRKPSDPLSWEYQASIHGVLPDYVDDMLTRDDGVDKIFQKRWWNQCPHQGENSANFLPWHRAYTYYFEKILRWHSEIDDFALPYWNYIDPANPTSVEPENRKFPEAFGVEHLDHNPNNKSDDNINSLFHPERDYYLCSYEHDFAKGLPYLTLGDSAVDIKAAMDAPIFFGLYEQDGLGGGIADEDPTTRGLLETSPHDPIHRVVGGIIVKIVKGKPKETVGAMATPPTAAFDPIFPVHHSQIDWLWAYWSCQPGKSWGYRPSSYWFNERPWFFWDIDEKAAKPDPQRVNEPRKRYFDYRALGIRFKGEQPGWKPLTLPESERDVVVATAPRVRTLSLLTQHKATIAALPVSKATISISSEAVNTLQPHIKALRNVADANSKERIILRLKDVNLGLIRGTGFDVHVTDNPKPELRRSDPSFVGSISLFRHSDQSAEMAGMHSSATGGQDESFDVTKAVAAVRNDRPENLSVILVPYSLLTVPGKETVVLNNTESLKASGVEFLRMVMR